MSSVVRLLRAMVLLFAGLGPAWGQTGSLIEQPDESLMRLFEVRLGPHQLEELVLAYQQGSSILLPLGLLSRILGLAIDTRPETGTAEGFVLQEHRGFFLDVERDEVTLDGIRAGFEPGLVHVYPDDIYVDSALLTAWLPLRIDVHLLTAQLQVEPEEPFPLQRRLERQRKNARLHRRPERRDYPVVEEPYGLADVPFVDQTVRLGRTENETGQESSAEYTAYGTGDLLFTESAWYLAVDDEEGLDEWRLTLGRADPRGGLLGPLKARQFALGHITSPGINLVSMPRSPEPGMVVGNYPLGQQTEFDTHTFEGDLPPGWDVELFHNNALIGYAQPDPSGRYRFEEVPLLFGNNHFRLVFHGPQGQRREENVTYVLGPSLVRPGEQYYRAFWNEDEAGHPHASLQYDVALTGRLTTSIAVSQLTPVSEETERQYLSLGARGFWDFLYVRLDSVLEEEGGRANELGLQTRIGPLNLSLSDTHLRDFVSDEFGSGSDLVERRTEGRVDAALPGSRITPVIPLVFEVERDVYASGRTRTQYRNRISAATSGVAATNSLFWTTATDEPDRLDGSFRLSYQRRAFGIRGEIFYLLQPRDEISSAQTTFDFRRPGGYRWFAGVNRSFSSNENQYFAGLSKQEGPIGYSINATHSTDGRNEVFLTATMGLWRDPLSKYWHTDARPLAGSGACSASAFLDTNRNGLLDEGEETLTDVEYTFNGGYRQPETTTRHGALVAGLPPHREVSVGLSASSLMDPLWVPAKEGFNAILRPGHVTALQFPVVMTGEVDGTVYIRRGDGETAIGGVQLQLIDENEQVIAATQSAYDGFYLFSQVPLGRFFVRVAPEQRERLGLSQMAAVPVQLTGEEFIRSHINLVLKRSE